MSQPIKTDFRSKYEAKGAQQVSLQDYLSKQEKTKNSEFKIPTILKYILAAPVMIIFCFGLIYIPYLIFQAATTPAHSSISSKSASHTSHR